MTYIRLYLSPFFMAVILNLCIFAQSNQEKISTAANNDITLDQSLQLTTSILEEKYCIGDGDLDLLRLRLKLLFNKIGNGKVILYIGSHSIYDLIVNRDDQRILNMSITTLFSDIPSSFDDASFRKYFVVLSNGASYDTEANISIPVFRNDRKNISGAIGPGKYTLQVKVSTWLASYDLAKELRVKWREKGFLWYDPVLSLPMPFEVIQERRVIKCDD